jgi:hypothetical protein
MPDFVNSKNKIVLDRSILRKNGISLLPLDERWKCLFASGEKPAEITAGELKVGELFKEQARLLAELDSIGTKKKEFLDIILKLTPRVFDKNSDIDSLISAKKQMEASRQEVDRLNERSEQLQQRLKEIPMALADENLKLLERTIDAVYREISSGRRRMNELEILIEKTKAELFLMIDEKEKLSQIGSETYTYFHELLGAEELEKLDRIFLSDRLSGGDV